MKTDWKRTQVSTLEPLLQACATLRSIRVSAIVLTADSAANTYRGKHHRFDGKQKVSYAVPTCLVWVNQALQLSRALSSLATRQPFGVCGGSDIRHGGKPGRVARVVRSKTKWT